VNSVDSETVNIALMKRETLELLRQFTLAANDEDLIRAAIKAICSYTRSIGGFYVSCVQGSADEDVVQVAAAGISQPFILFDELNESLTEAKTLGQFRGWIANIGWKDISRPCEILATNSNFVGSSLYCLPVRNVDNDIIGFIGLENFSSPFKEPKLEGILVLLTAIDVRLRIAQGSFSSQGVIVNKIIHDVNGGLSIIGLQNEMLSLETGKAGDTKIVRNRIKTGLQKVDEAVTKLHDFSAIFFNQQELSQQTSINSILNAALISIPIGADLKSKIHVSTDGIEHEGVDLDVIVLYWLYRTVIAAWANPDLWDPSDPTEMFIDLEYGPTKTECVHLVLSRDVNSSIDKGMLGLFGFNHGLTQEGLVIMSQAFALNYWVSLYGGASTFAESGGVRRITVCVPLAP
jgi:hypothetical protein